MRGFLLWLLSCVAYAMKGVETVYRAVQEQVKEREHQIVYKEFEAAIHEWEKRTGKVVERETRATKEKDKDGFTPGQWKNFAMFLGSREAAKWRRSGKSAISFEKAIEEWKKLGVSEPEMEIEGEEEMMSELKE